MHAMATCHRGIGCPLDKDTDLNREDPETAEMEIENTHGFDATDCIECKLRKLTITIHTPTPTEPLKEVIQHYMNTLCTAQKQTNLTTSLLQDIPVFHGHDATW